MAWKYNPFTGTLDYYEAFSTSMLPSSSAKGCIVGCSPQSSGASAWWTDNIASAGGGGRFSPLGDAGFYRNLSAYFQAAQATGALVVGSITENNTGQIKPTLPFYSGLVGTIRETKGFLAMPKGSVGHPTLTGIASVAATRPTSYAAAKLLLDGGGTLLGRYLGTATIGASTTAWAALNGRDAGAFTPDASKAATAIAMPFAGTLRGLMFGNANAQPGTGSLVATVFKGTTVAGWSATSLTATLAASQAAGMVVDFTNNVSVAAGDLISVKFQNNATGTSAQIQGVTLLFEPTVAGNFLMTGGFQGGLFGSPNYWQPMTAKQSGTENVNRMVLPRDGTLKSLYVYCSAAFPATDTFKVWKNGSATALAITTTALGAEGIYSAVTDVAFSALDTISVEWVNGGSGSARPAETFAIGYV